MNNKILIGIVVLVIVVGAIFLLSKSNTPAPATQQTNQQVTQTQQPTEATTMSPTTSAQTTPSQQTNQQNIVTLTTNGFSPAELTIKAGTKVTWINKSGEDATVNSNPHPVHTDYPPLNLGGFSDGQSLSLIFDKPGNYGYHNHLNPSQLGTITVQ